MDEEPKFLTKDPSNPSSFRSLKNFTRKASSLVSFIKKASEGVFIIMVYVFAVLHGSAWGLRGPLMATIRADYFGRAYFPTIMGFSSLIVMFGMTIGPLFAGYMADVFGNYKLGFIMIAAFAALGSVFFILARQPKLPERYSRA